MIFNKFRVLDSRHYCLGIDLLNCKQKRTITRRPLFIESKLLDLLFDKSSL